jgi:hypothetical protein
VSFETHSEAMINRVWRCTWKVVIVGPSRPESCGFRDSSGGHDQGRLKQYVEAGNLKAVDRKGGATGGETLFIGSLVFVGIWRIEYNIIC